MIVGSVSGLGGQEETSKGRTTRLVQLTPIFSASQLGKLNGLHTTLDGASSGVSYSCDSQAVVLWCRLFWVLELLTADSTGNVSTKRRPRSADRA